MCGEPLLLFLKSLLLLPLEGELPPEPNSVTVQG